MILSKAKLEYKKLIKDHFLFKVNTPIFLKYVYFSKTNSRVDVANPCSIIDKFASDVMVDMGCIEDDNSDFVIGVAYMFGGVDKKNPRCEMHIIPQ